MKQIKLSPETEKMFKQFLKDSEWISKNYLELVEKYDHVYIAVRKGKVRYYDKSLFQLLTIMRNAGEEPAQWAIDYIHSEPIYHV